MLKLTIIDTPADETPYVDTWVVGPAGGTVGRSRNNSWSLPDKSSEISRTHCEVICEKGQYLLLDKSKNGTYIDGSETPLGPGEKAVLKDGCKIQLGRTGGGYTLQVSIQAMHAQPVYDIGDRPEFIHTTPRPEVIPLEPDIPHMPSAENNDVYALRGPSDLGHIDPISKGSQGPDIDPWQPQPETTPEQFTPASPPRQYKAPVTNRASESLDIPDNWYEIESAPVTPPTPEPVPQPVPPPFPATGPGKDGASVTSPDRPGSSQNQNTGDSADYELEASLRQLLATLLGEHSSSLTRVELLRIVEGLVTIFAESTPMLMHALASRARFKESLRLNSTSYRRVDNNPLKPDSSLTAREAIQHMLLNDDPGFLHGNVAVREAFRELEAHQTAMLAALRPTLMETLEHFSPQKIQSVAGKEPAQGFAIPKGKGKLWDTYLEIYTKMTESGRGSIEHRFMHSLARFYEASLLKEEK